VAGNGIAGFSSGDLGPATSASLDWPFGVAVDAAGNILIADYYNYRVRKVTGGMITTVAGNGVRAFRRRKGRRSRRTLSATGWLWIRQAMVRRDCYNYRVRAGPE